MQQAMHNYLAARDQVAAVRSTLFPTLSANAGFTHSQTSRHRPLASSTGNTSFNDLVLGGQAAWEPDFWGRIRRTVEASRASAQASAAEMANISLSLQAELAADYFQLRGLDSQIKLLKSTVGDLERQLDLTQRRLKGGVATAADVEQAETQLETVRAQLVDESVGRAQFEHAVGTIANYSLPDFSIPFSPLDLAMPKVPIGVPSQLLERRPDIASQERQTAAANARIGIAVAAYYPTISLNGIGGFESTHGGTWIQGPSALWSLGAQAAELLFDAGQRRALTDQARELYEAQAAAYRNTVLQAFQDVEDNLSSLRILDEETAVEAKAVSAAQRSFTVSNQRYKGGVTSYLEVLTAEDALLNNQRTLTDLETRQFAGTVLLIRALGGGWDTTQLPK
jgi:NodT family efflux transporter outer membrane factor (OMF) lipoprotein